MKQLIYQIVNEILNSAAPQDIGAADPVIVNAKRKFQAAAKPVIASFIKALQSLEQRKVITTADNRAIKASIVSDIMTEYDK